MEIEERFKLYNNSNPNVYKLFKTFAIKAVNAAIEKNIKYISADMIAHRVRWEVYFNYDGDYKINNNWVAYYSRMFQEEYPEYRMYFRNRKTTQEKAETAYF